MSFGAENTTPNSNILQCIGQGTTTQLAPGASAATSAAFANGTSAVQVSVELASYILFSAAGTAVTSTTGMYVPAGYVGVWRVPRGQAWKVSVISADGATTGKCSVMQGATT